MFIEPPTLRFFSIPTPPSTTRAPVSLLVDSVISPMLIATPSANAQSAPSISNLLSVASSYLSFTSLSLPKLR